MEIGYLLIDFYKCFTFCVGEVTFMFWSNVLRSYAIGLEDHFMFLHNKTCLLKYTDVFFLLYELDLTEVIICIVF